MSADTLRALDAAITAHVAATNDDFDGMVTAWIVAVETTHADSGGVSYGQDYTTSESPPSSVAGLARWAGMQIETDAMPVTMHEGDDDE